MICSLFVTLPVYGYTFVGLRENSVDLNIRPGDKISYSQDQGEKRILWDIDFVNKWLWFALWFVCFGFIVYNGFRLVASRGDSEAFKKTKTGIIGAAIGIVVCFLSYGIVRVIINLFK